MKVAADLDRAVAGVAETSIGTVSLIRHSPIARRRDRRICIRLGSSEGIVNGYEFCAVGEGALDLHFMNHFRHALHDIFASRIVVP